MTKHTALAQPLGRKAVVLGALAVTLAGCAQGEVAEFEEGAPATGITAAEGTQESDALGDAEATTTEAAEPLVAEPGLVHEDISQSPAVLETIRPERGAVITPAGTLTIKEVQAVETVSSEEIGLAGEPGQSEARAADGEEFRIVTMSFSPDEATQNVGFESATLDADAALALNLGGVQHHLHDLDESRDFRILISVPQDGSGRLTVSSEGHDQFVDLLTGERVEDEVAAGYYREVTRQDLNHKFPVDSHEVLLESSSLSQQENAVIDYDTRVNSVELAAWSDGEGWAAPGQAWLVVDWGYEVSMEFPFGLPPKVEDIVITLTAAAGTETQEDTVHDQGGSFRNKDSQVSVFAVPIETPDVELSMSGTADFVLDDPFIDIVDQSQTDLTFSSDPLKVSFPDTRYASTSSEADQGDQAEQTSGTGEDSDG